MEYFSPDFFRSCTISVQHRLSKAFIIFVNKTIGPEDSRRGRRKIGRQNSQIRSQLFGQGGRMLRNQMVVLSGLRSLRIASHDGAPSNEYRIQKDKVEFRSLNPDGIAFGRSDGGWRTLEPNEIKLHFALETPVAQWLSKNLYALPEADA